MQKDFDSLKDMLSENDDQLTRVIKEAYVSGLVKALSMVNTSLTMYVFYKHILKSDKEATIKLFEGFFDEVHVELMNRTLKSMEGNEELTFFKDEIDDLISNIKKTLEETYKGIKQGMRDSFEGVIKQFSELNDPGDTKKGSE